MLYQKKKKYMKTERRIYAFVLLFIIALFLMRVYGGNIEAAENAGLLIRLSDQYQMGTVYDRNGNAIVQGTDGEWNGPEIRRSRKQWPVSLVLLWKIHMHQG